MLSSMRKKRPVCPKKSLKYTRKETYITASWRRRELADAQVAAEKATTALQIARADASKAEEQVRCGRERGGKANVFGGAGGGRGGGGVFVLSDEA